MILLIGNWWYIVFNQDMGIKFGLHWLHESSLWRIYGNILCIQLYWKVSAARFDWCLSWIPLDILCITGYSIYPVHFFNVCSFQENCVMRLEWNQPGSYARMVNHSMYYTGSGSISFPIKDSIYYVIIFSLFFSLPLIHSWSVCWVLIW